MNQFNTFFLHALLLSCFGNGMPHCFKRFCLLVVLLKVFASPLCRSLSSHSFTIFGLWQVFLYCMKFNKAKHQGSLVSLHKFQVPKHIFFSSFCPGYVNFGSDMNTFFHLSLPFSWRKASKIWPMGCQPILMAYQKSILESQLVVQSSEHLQAHSLGVLLLV